MGFVARHDKLYDSVLRSSREQVEFTNGSVVHALPASGLIRGLTATRVLVNEARDVLDEEETYDDYADALMLTCWAFRPRGTRMRVRVNPRARPPWG